MSQCRVPAVAAHPRTLPLLLLLMILAGVSSLHSQDVLTYHNNNARTGADLKERTLTLANVNSATFGKLFTVPADGLVDAQPLYVSGVSISGVTHNLLIVASEHGTVYAYDADTGTNLWHVTTVKSG
jgi:outer membrane protein assembly factor BamB